MKKTIKIIYIILLIILIKLVFTFIINEVFILKYNDGEYKESALKKLLVLNVMQPYIAHYNYGNVMYKNENYDKAITEYEKALKTVPKGKEKECSIRINLALAMISKIDASNGKEEAIKKLNEARQVLCENGCAHQNDDKGHSKKAETLKKDIDNAIKQLQDNNTNPEGNENEEENEEENNEEENNRTVEEKLRELERQSREERNAEMEETRQLTQKHDYLSDKKNW